MADEETLAALFGGMNGASNSLRPASSGYADLNQFQNTIKQNDIYGDVANLIGGARFNTSTWSPGQTAGVTAGQAFLNTILKGLGQRSEARQMNAVSKVLPELYNNPGNVSVPDGVDSDAFEALKLASVRNSALRNATLGQEDAEFTRKLKGSVMSELFSKRPDLAMKALGIQDTRAKSIEAPAIEALSPKTGLEEGGKSTAEKMTAYYKAFLDQDMPPVQAAAAARQQVEGEIKANTGSFDKGKEARDYGQKLLDLASTTKAGMSQAGQTGSMVGLRNVGDYIAANVFGSEDSAKKLVGNQLLASIAPEVVKMNRSPGAVSDYEAQMLIGAAPSVNQRPETNAILAAKMEDLGKLNLDYADFLDAYKNANSGNISGAEKKWAEYRQAFPLFNDKTGEITKDRPSWQEYFANPGAVKTEKTISALEFAAQAKAAGLSKDEARAEWNKRKGAS